ncbi:DUF402 domain-containing protein [Nocardioides guangzhouensis]|uniref:DUF402 domain-containing protein n=1 Tax=Nocardioides guangzhouensis TaxID=2497878 RepID=A0A4Q4ZBW8_9ACTN|nr:DUF402 domain-containing protein [Nocardioides guangzhouensis]RYP85510.1 DUF402 domain-containing protein [Nocardioides guangzhouensis]
MQEVPPPPGTRVDVVMTKWRERPHWEFAAVLLGTDEHGDWLGIPGGTHMSRPGAEYVAPVDQVGLVPAAAAAERGWLATFHARGGQVEVYVDITTPPHWDGTVLRAVDLDLDVVRGTTGRVWVDDEDEFAEHRIAYDYPTPLVVHATHSCDHVLGAVQRRVPPYDGSPAAWLEQVATLRT